MLYESTYLQTQVTTTVTDVSTSTIIPPPATQTSTATTTIVDVSITTIIPPPVTQTSTTTTSETLYPIISTWTTTEKATLTICPPRTINPTFTAQYPIPTEFTWGCPPGYLCKPDQINCNFEAGLPSEEFYCSPDQCIAASAPGVPQLWDPTIYGNSSPATDPSLRFTVIDHYFNMNPQDFGLTYDIFIEEEAFTFTSTIGYAPTAAVAARQAQTSVPGACYTWCNNCLIEAQSVGKTPALCAPGSDYEKDLANCQQCIKSHSSSTTDSYVKIAPQFQQFMAYCASVSAPSTTPTPTATVYSTSTLTVQPELSLSTSSSVTTITTPVPPLVPSATSSSTEWVVPSGSTTITFASSPAVTTQWTVTSSSSTFVFTTNPSISGSAIVFGDNSTTTVPVVTASTISVTASGTASLVTASSLTTSSSTPASSSAGTSTTSSAASSAGTSSPAPPTSTFSGIASRNIQGLLVETIGLLSFSWAVVLMMVTGW